MQNRNPSRWLVVFGGLLLAGCAPVERHRLEAFQLPAPHATEIQVTGTIVRISKIPAQKRSRYADGYFTALVRCDQPAELRLVVFPGFLQFERRPEADYQAGQRLRMNLKPFEAASPEQQSAQILDTLNELESPWFWCSASFPENL